jgi:hypothetical protein
MSSIESAAGERYGAKGIVWREPLEKGLGDVSGKSRWRAKEREQVIVERAGGASARARTRLGFARDFLIVVAGRRQGNEVDPIEQVQRETENAGSTQKQKGRSGQKEAEQRSRKELDLPERGDFLVHKGGIELW